MPKTDKQFQRLIDRAARLAEQHHAALEALGEACEERYGAHYSDVDCDSVIDVCEGTGGTLTVAEVDEAMKLCGHPRIS